MAAGERSVAQPAVAPDSRTRSTGLNSGLYGSGWIRVRLAGTLSPSLMCRPAPSSTSPARLPAGTARDGSAGKTPVAAVETSGSARATLPPRPGHTATDGRAEVRLCRRTPFRYRTWVRRSFRPTRAPPGDQTPPPPPGPRPGGGGGGGGPARPPPSRPGRGVGGPSPRPGPRPWTIARPAPRGARARPPRSRRAGFLEPPPRLWVGLGVDRPGLPPRGIEPLERLEHPALAVADPEPLLDQGAQVAGVPSDAAVARSRRGPHRTGALRAAC